MERLSCMNRAHGLEFVAYALRRHVTVMIRSTDGRPESF